jgi:hypothetical protein
MHAKETPDYIRKAIAYDPENGRFIWKLRSDATARWNLRWAGKSAGYQTPRGYHRIKLNLIPYPAHRLAWVIHYGYWPIAEIDHINGIHHDNRIANLREATRNDNSHNQGKQRNNTSGFKGVSRMPKSRRQWIATIGYQGKKLYLGGFNTREEAAQAYAKAAASLHGQFARTE